MVANSNYNLCLDILTDDGHLAPSYVKLLLLTGCVHTATSQGNLIPTPCTTLK